MPTTVDPIPVTSGQIDDEWSHLSKKLTIRSPKYLEKN
jgi:hypothetical protein